MKIEIHVYNHHGLELDLLKAIHKLLRTMATKTDFDALRDEINASLVNLSGDITRLTDQLVGGGLTAEEETAVLAEFREVAARIKLMADRTADPANGNP